MAVYTYKATNSNKTLVRGTITSDTPRQAREELRSKGLVVKEVTEHRQTDANARRGLPQWGSRYGAKATTTIRELSTLLSVGVPLLEALDTLVVQYRGGYHTVLLVVRDRVAAGGSLADAMAEQGTVFDSLSVHMVEVGENSGTLDEVLGKLADFKQRSLELKDRVISAILYPAIVLSVAMGVSIFLMTVVVPMLLENLLDAGRVLPWPTRVLKTMSDLLLGYGPLLALFVVGIVVLVAMGLRTDRGKKIWNRILLKTPILGPMSQKQELARVALVIATLMKSGIVFLQAIEIAGRTTKNLLMREALESCGRQVSAGRDIGEALKASPFMPHMVVHIFSVGQKSGRLEEMLERLSRDYDAQVESAAGRLSSALEPILILILAVFVGFILFATMLPILEAGNVL